MKQRILKQLTPLTKEEKEILSNKKVSTITYTSQPHFTQVESKKFLADDESMMIRKHTRFAHFPKHSHDYIEVSYVLRGSLTQTVADKTLTLNEGDLMFLNQHINHEIQPCKQEDIIINFIIQPNFFEYIFSFLNMKGPIYRFLMDSLYTYSYRGQYLTFNTNGDESIQELLLSIIYEMLQPQEATKARVKLKVGLLLVELSQSDYQFGGAETLTLHTSWVQETIEYINSSYKTATLKDMASQLELQDYALSKIIKQITNQTFKQLLKEKRLAVAKEMLAKTDLPITTIVHEVGYDNVSYFYRVFQREFGMTPKDFRASV
ncbi:AraC family transcriptional regulator [Alkalicoccobacillus porphyridii]|uniref:Helix-turn-helix domain-containing protein n=1 Tax=Alkalicoccobacillus porphyridii TaxID=2597270 RepID=A0A554A0R8_9BACI|nr:AraC family transcriptional regulator [Alkalicoccobacillus porphyridii]TSB47285.1 helix-turn-helix domain-containing protein [Alkalicoccobacillus porphyridii]